MSEMPRIPTGQIGRSPARVEARAKVTGTAEYIHNLRLPGMLWAKICRSTVPHGRIRRIDTSAAAAIPGVLRIVTATDIRTVITEPYYGPAFHDQPILAEGKVRHVGEPVVAVLAADPRIAAEAAQAITALKRTRIALLGYPMNGMGDILYDPPALLRRAARYISGAADLAANGGELPDGIPETARSQLAATLRRDADGLTAITATG